MNGDNMKLVPKDPVKPLIKIAYISVLVLFVVFIVPRLIKFFLPVLFAIVISLIIAPIVDFLVKKFRINRRVSVIVAMLFVISVLGTILFNLIYQAVYFLQGFGEKLPELLNKEYVFFDWFGSFDAFMIKMPESMQSFVDNIGANVLENISELITPATKAAINAAGTIAAQMPTMLIFTVVMLLATYFISYDKNSITEKLKITVNPERYVKIKLIKDKLFKACGAYFRAQLIMMGIMFCYLVVAYLVLGIKPPFFIAFITALVDAIPILGTGTVLVPWAIFQLITGEYVMAIGLFVIYVLAIVIRQFTEPRVVSAQIGLHPLITITAMYAGLKAIGVLGMILGPVVTLIVIKAIEIEKELEEHPVQSEGVTRSE